MTALAPRPDLLAASEARRRLRRMAYRALAGLMLLATVVGVWFTNTWLTERFTETTRMRTELRLALYSGNILSELQRTSVVPLLLARDPELTKALGSGDFSTTSGLLIAAREEVGVASIRLLDLQGRVMGATDRNVLGTVFNDAPFFVDAQRTRETVFSAVEGVTGASEFVYSRAVLADGKLVGVIVVGADLARYERAWAGISDAVAVMDSAGKIVLATEPRWRGLTMEEALVARSAPSAIERALQATADWANDPPDAWVLGQAVMRTEARVPFRGWRMVAFTPYSSVRDRVNAVIALEIMGFAILLALGFYLISRRAKVQSAVYRRESAELRALNARLSREIAERERVQKDLSLAEQTLEQSSKLAVLGEMSAAVSHELNQPLAAMKTYLAGAKLLLQRERVPEALSSFQRIDDLIERMGAITRQLKSYARKGGDAIEPVDLRAALSSALAMMEPQLKARTVKIVRNLPRGAVMVQADRIRLEQVIINLFRNALDATKGLRAPRIEITLVSEEEVAVLTLADNGPGLTDLEKLFEPFWTTKKPGEGTGLGLAISSSIVADFGGRLTARNGEGGGAVFEMRLPRLMASRQTPATGRRGTE
ncbi:sensor histidine kinase [Rhodobacter capsulatus]|uniref:C4-dicarboxylate transport sensor protein DctB n=2 Tax=Rhodobacter capsulatus TaxID=1061 RepID=D5AVB5_RHOCB|nr:C4-dicarboxylate transport sensor protein DctB [Rhodobacter capsulatus SB 1003]ETD01006.1 cytochrome C biogenesis protein CcmE [Rhodobacter capsulatus DE442]ETD76058.1 cytochrome C biogenesis protein CcmE [Rhodobacter capsulatus R121]ETD79805.1 cytochrome C biogenesis protein CcmE [Rhodobacter capsulatus B6]ETD81294.1 cytochrome C biogenesis protein CcmE [Rhodobacter capsulatus YW1]ETD88984.1 cytochrome C biogenesis protein CcmE [Rhodobacter capsulatus YW2]ETE53223.1 cytochrome C biogenesi